jgi:hypothetical protein
MVIFGILAVTAIVVLGTVALAYFSRPPQTLFGVPTAVVTILPAPTVTSIILATEIPAPTSTPDVPPPPPPGTINLGAFVQISGTDGKGLNLRDAAGLDAGVLYLGIDSEVFVVREGPTEIDGLTWWYIEGFADTSRTGWAASNFLEVIQNP